ncbi:cupin domain-containing protein [Neptunicella marina]|uniref:Cupin domain-containing protein n=1 Tax=Neptunicella marina TaxID=2125989 RepID=A0A8J6LVB7_9ALTE|nr:cupin domain-containing protein [Neptunicella marina]MBC3764484.1 cupin domain-containing protein [Neptunicella marina]
MFTLHHLEPKTFLRDYWQKKPLLIRQGFKDFVDPLDEHDLAGLAMEEDIDARIVSQINGQWHLTQGPFESFDALCVGQWSLLVQNVDGYIDDASSLLNAFNFIPRWRVDDLMVSFSVPGAGVGPHLDQYDVFIIQGKGKRHWQVGDKGQHKTLLPHPKLSQVAAFEPIIDAVLQPGDILYIPPGFPHCGEAITDCLNYSVGFRAPDQKALLSDFADYALIQQNYFNERYQDPDLPTRKLAGELKLTEITQLKAMMKRALDDPECDHWLASYLSFANDTLRPPTPLLNQQQVHGYICEGGPVYRRLDVKPIWRESRTDKVVIHMGDSHFELTQSLLPVVESLFSATEWCYCDDLLATELAGEDLSALTQLLTQWLNLGYWSCELHDDMQE